MKTGAGSIDADAAMMFTRTEAAVAAITEAIIDFSAYNASAGPKMISQKCARAQPHEVWKCFPVQEWWVGGMAGRPSLGLIASTGSQTLITYI